MTTTLARTLAPEAAELTAVSAVPARPRGRRWRTTLTGYLFILPGIIGFGLMVLYPALTSLYHSFTKWNGLTAATWVGFDNFVYLFTKDPLFWPSLRATAYYVLLTVPASMVAGLALALLINRRLAGVKIFRTVFYLPVVLPAVAVLTLWKYIYEPTYGLANQVLEFLHLPTSMWLGDAKVALPAIVIVNIWGIGGTMIIFLAGLQAVPQELYEAAMIDGAGPIRRFVGVTLPMMGPILVLQLMLQVNGAFQTFTQVAILTKGGPGVSTNLLMYKIYNDGFGDFISSPQLGYATAEVWVLFVIVMVVTALLLRLSNRFAYEGDAA
ncbi:carbohydrate ABC transporter permease [Aestuariimicrobium soli]|uniref:carbohydrate ABC transporter permease n=1 Tax=Aestuariimicrobium soli TaxID=2035834 RepID=UPI003EBC884C